MVLDREEEAKRMMNGGGGYGGAQDLGGYGAGAGGYGGAQGVGLGYDQQQFQPQAPNMNDIAQPKARKMAAAAKPQEDEDEGWGDAGALLD